MNEFEEILSTLESGGVKYLIVGGYALMFYCEPRYTKDIDLFVEASPDNAERVFNALRAFGAPLAGLTPKDFTEPNCVYQMGRPPLRIDVMTSIDGVAFEEAWAARNRVRFGEVEANLISREHLIQNKRASGRHIDLHDIEQLENGE